MKEFPILLNTKMVQAVDKGFKTQTRRTNGLELVNKEPDKWKLTRLLLNESSRQPGLYAFFTCSEGVKAEWGFKCRFGSLGDRLWVRETWAESGFEGNYIYKALWEDPLIDAERWRPSIHMPKEAARNWLKIKNVRVERLQSISPSDALCEGIEWCETDLGWKNYLTKIKLPAWPTPYHSFQSLWESTYGADSWELNPWLWVIEFTQIEPEGVGS